MSTHGGGHGAARTPRPTGPVVLGALLALAGLVWLLAAAGAVPVSAQVAIGLLLVVVGAAVALLPPGGHHGVLVAAGIALALVATALVSLNLHLVEAGFGDRRAAPASLTEVQHRYELGIGTLGIDLTRLDLEGAEGAIPVRAAVGIGELVVAVPREASLVVDAHVSMGEIDVRGERRSGFDVRLRTEDEAPAGAPTAFRLQLEGAIGSIRVVDDDLGGAGGGD